MTLVVAALIHVPFSVMQGPRGTLNGAWIRATLLFQHHKFLLMLRRSMWNPNNRAIFREHFFWDPHFGVSSRFGQWPYAGPWSYLAWLGLLWGASLLRTVRETNRKTRLPPPSAFVGGPPKKEDVAPIGLSSPLAPCFPTGPVCRRQRSPRLPRGLLRWGTQIGICYFPLLVEGNRFRYWTRGRIRT